MSAASMPALQRAAAAGECFAALRQAQCGDHRSSCQRPAVRASFRPDDADIASADEFAGGQERGQGQAAGLVKVPEARWESEGIAVSYEDSTERLTEVERFIDVTFYPEGGSSGGTLIFSRGDRHTRIVIDPFTGRISSEETNAPI